MEINKEKLLLIAPKERYEQQLNDVRWKFKADNIRIRDKHECRLCGAKKTQLDVHHIRYISGREAWDYDDGDLVTLCHKCHEELHDGQDYEKIVPGWYFYDKFLEGVGIVERKTSEGVSFNVCWTECEHYTDNHQGRIFSVGETSRHAIREARPNEIADFWVKVENYYGDSIDMLIEDFGKHLKNLLPENHPLRIKARKRFKEALAIYEQQKSYIKETFDYFLLVSEESFAVFEDNHVFGSPCPWPSDTLPCAYFIVAPTKDVYNRPEKNNRKHIMFNDFDFTGYRAATQEEVYKWVEYEEHIANLNDFCDDDLPF